MISMHRYPRHRFPIVVISHNFPFFSQRGGTEYTSFRVALIRGARPLGISSFLKGGPMSLRLRAAFSPAHPLARRDVP
ncbi:MAG: hypothetical protein HXY51_04585 [Nitrospirae bacterium]|nr:hypothetical protein [Nitrospirota bacterium]